MIFPSINPVALNIGPLVITWYGLSYLFGFLLARYYLLFLSKKNFQKISKLTIDEFFGNSILGVILGGRLGYVLFYNPFFYFNNPQEIFFIWNGGMSFHGGLIGVSLAIIYTAKKQKISILVLSDITSLASPIGLFFGRIANFINAELYGRVTEHPLGIIFPRAGNLPRHPSQLYEAFFEGIILFLFLNLAIFVFKIQKFNGLLTGMFLFGYGVSRFLIEYVREPDDHLGLFFLDFTIGQILCFPMIIIGISIIYLIYKNARYN